MDTETKPALRPRRLSKRATIITLAVVTATLIAGGTVATALNIQSAKDAEAAARLEESIAWHRALADMQVAETTRAVALRLAQTLLDDAVGIVDVTAGYASEDHRTTLGNLSVLFAEQITEAAPASDTDEVLHPSTQVASARTAAAGQTIESLRSSAAGLEGIIIQLAVVLPDPVQTILDAAPLADPAVRQTLADAAAAIKSFPALNIMPLEDVVPSTLEPVERQAEDVASSAQLATNLRAHIAAYVDAAKATQESHAAVAAAQANTETYTAPDGTVKPNPRYVSDGGSSGGDAGGSTGGSNEGPAGGGSGGPPPPPAFTLADAVAAVANAWGGSSAGGDCQEMNSGPWPAGATPPQPAWSLLKGGSLGWDVSVSGNGGWVQYWACF